MACHDVIIAGAGAAGLCLGLALIRGPLRGASILIVDHAAKDRDDRTFAFWEPADAPADPLVSREWSQLQVIGDGFDHLAPLRTHRYRMIRAIDLYRAARAELGACPGVELRRAEVGAIVDGGHAASAEIDGERVEGRFIFDSRMSADRLPRTRRRVLLAQRFVGWEVEAPAPVFRPEVATLFDFRGSERARGEFFYVLPLSERRALVERVEIGTPALGDAEGRLADRLARYHGVDAPLILRREAGQSPLTDHRFRRRLGQRVMAIGIAGGRLKPSSGYAFARIRADASAIAGSLARLGHPFDVPRESPRYRLLDAVLLQVMRRRPDLLPDVFRDMFSGSTGDRVLAFLDEETPFEERLALFRGLPKGPFAAAFGRLVLTRLGLAPAA